MHRSILVLAFLALVLTASQSNAQTLTILASLNGTDGNQPYGGLTLVGSTLYGMAYRGGANDSGTIFSIPVTGGTPTVLHSFNNDHIDGSLPQDGLTLDGSTLYGTTSGGGAMGNGTIFSIPLSGGTPTILTSFDTGEEQQPTGNLTLSGSTFYGTTLTGGSGDGTGTVFSMPVSGGNPTILASLGGPNGQLPFGDVTLSADGQTLYGMTNLGGQYNDGTIFSVPVTGGTPTVLASFDGTNGRDAFGSLTLVGSTLFGMTYAGGVCGNGNIFSIPVTGGTPTNLVSFDGTNGESPSGSLVFVGSTFYGTTRDTIFSLPLGGGPLTTLATFNGTNADQAYGTVTVSGATLYGTTVTGGQYDDGTIYSLTLPTPEPSSLVLLGMGAIGLGAMARRHRKSTAPASA